MESIQEIAFAGSCSPSRALRTRVKGWMSVCLHLGADYWLDTLFALAFFVALFSMPGDAGAPNLDNSWGRALQECFKVRAQAGSDYLFTYGPLGIFAASVYAEEFYWPKYFWELGFNLAVTAIVVLFGRRIAHKDARFLFYAILLVYGTQAYDLRFVISPLTLAVLLLVSAPRLSALVLAGLFLAVLCLVKFTFAIFAVPAILLVTAWKWWETDRCIVVALPLTFVAGVISLWLATGQALANLPKFVAGSLEMARGYVEAMSVAGPSSSLYLALAILGLDVLICLAVALYARRKARFLVCLALMFVALYLQFRHGFIRHDDHHCRGFFGFAMTVPFFIVVIEPIAAARWGVRLGFGLSLVLAAQAFQNVDGVQTPDAPRRVLTLYHTLRSQLNCMTHPRAHQTKLRQIERWYCDTCELPKIKAWVGAASIDMVSHLQGMLFLNGLHWTPRPVFQSYVTYTSKLLDANREFYRGSRAPRFVLFRLDCIDSRFPNTEDSGVLLELLQHYRPVVKEKGYCLFERQEEADGAKPPPPLRTAELTIRLGEEIPLLTTTDEYLMASFRFRLRTSGKLLHVLYRNPLLYVNVLLSDGSRRRYRLIPGMAANEFLLNPLMEDNDDFIDLYHGNPSKRILSLTLTQEDFHGWQPYHPDVQLTLKVYPPTLVPKRLSTSPWNSLRYAALGAAPRRVEKEFSREVSVDGQDCLIVDRGTVTYAVRPGQRRLSGRYGIAPGAYGPGKTDGVEFVVEYVSPSGERMVLFQRRLAPNESPGDRGGHTFSVELPRNHHGGTLQLHTQDSPPHTAFWDWSYWSQVRLE